MPFKHIYDLNTREQKRTINVFNIDFFAPTIKPPILGPQKKLCASFSGKERQKRGPCKLFGVDFGVKKGGPKQAIFGY